VRYSLYLAIAGVASASADTSAQPPKSLRMRAGKHVAQAPPPDQPAAGGDQAGDRAGDPPGAEPGAPPIPESAQAPPPAAQPPADQPSAELSDADFEKLANQGVQEEVIFVTGSTIGRRSLTTSAPLTILDRELLRASGQSMLGDIIQQLPEQSNGANAQLNVGGDGSTRVDLRGLGAFRTLTLINGRRVVPNGLGANVPVDLNMIPIAIVERVEILKDGASAVYGSDAIGGVVNVITRSDFDGSEASIYTGETQRGDGLTYDASFVTGYNSPSKKSNVVFSAGVQTQRPVFAGERAFSANDMSYDYVNRVAVPGGSTAAPWGRIASTAIDTNGDGRPDPVDLCGAQYCTSNGAGGYRPFVAPTDLYNYQPRNYIYTPSDRYHLYSAGSHQLSSLVSAFFETSYMNRKSAQQLGEESFINAAPISKASMYNPLGGTILGYQRRLVEFGPRRTQENIDTFRMVGGLKGAVPDDVAVLKNFKWELSYNYGRSDTKAEADGGVIRSRLATALGPSFMSAAGVPTCGTPTKPIPGCVPMNILGPAGSIDPAAASYVTFTGLSSGFNQQQTVLAQAHGQLATLPNNGDLSLAVGGDYRKESGGFTPDPVTAIGDTVGTAIAPTVGSYSVAEGFGELSLVPISGKPLARWVELSLAARAFRYDTFGSGVTWKAGGMYRMVDSFALRGTYSTAFRAPSVSELFQGTTSAFLPAVDPCDSRPPGGMVTLSEDVAAECANQGVAPGAAFGSALIRQQFSSNSKLKAESAKVVTAGIVIEPPQVKRLSLTVDYWRVDIAHAIQRLGTNAVFTNCYTHHDPGACAQIHRNPVLGNSIDYVDLQTQNVGGAAHSGLDFALAYEYQLGGAGRFRELLESQYLLKANLDNTVQTVHGLNNNDLSPRPRVRGIWSSLWEHPSGAGAGFNLRYVGSYKECEQNACSSGAAARDVPQWYKADVFGSYSFKSRAGKTELTIGVNNVLDRSPPALYGGLGDYDPSYDFKGRFYYTRMSQQF
jgi:outer membrane receptor protein involved in Fe transport